MIGIYRKWKSRDVVIKYEGRIQTYAKLKRTIAFRGKKHRLDEQDLSDWKATLDPPQRRSITSTPAMQMPISLRLTAVTGTLLKKMRRSATSLEI
jgi:hypothetical protein